MTLMWRYTLLWLLRVICAKIILLLCGLTTCSSDKRLAKVAFTGSVISGRKVNACAAMNGIPTTMELGGKSALLVFDDADVEKAVEWCMVRSLLCLLMSCPPCAGKPNALCLPAHGTAHVNEICLMSCA